ncbi:MAG: carboxymuconolactone decarboxylase family protein [Terracidiphilus sp.]|jgi:AhpD family alkylhydroperoxidase
MQPRLNDAKASPEGIQAFLKLGKVVKGSGLELSLLELVKIRASQINGCAYCIDLHTKDAQAAGESEQRICALSAWRETPFFTPRERAALAWTEELTKIQQSLASDQAYKHASDQAYEEVRTAFDETDLVKLTLSITSINTWNRLALSFQPEPGSDQPSARS